MGSRSQGNRPKAQQKTTDKTNLKGNPSDERDQKIKAEADTARVRSERQSVIDSKGKGRL